MSDIPPNSSASSGILILLSLSFRNLGGAKPGQRMECMLPMHVFQLY